MITMRKVWVPVVLGGFFTAGLVAIPSAAMATGDPVVEESGDTITYTDPALQNERTTTVEGTLRVAYIDRVDSAGRPSSEIAYSVVTEDGEAVPVEVAGELPADAANGDIAAEVVDEGSADAQLAEATVETAQPASAPVGSSHDVYVVLVAKTGQLPTEGAVAARLRDNVLDEWVTESDGAISGFTVEGTATLSADAPTDQSKSDVCSMANYAGLWSAGAAQFPGVDFDTVGTPNHLIMVVSGAGCSSERNVVLGIGTVGESIDDGGLTTLLWDERYVDATGVHELGHNFSLGHANALSCDSCVVDEYFDIFSVMGFGTPDNNAPALDTGYRDVLGISQPGEVEAIAKESAATSTVTRTIQPRGSSSGLRGLSVVDPMWGRTYWIENRAGGTGDRDAGASYVNKVLNVTRSVSGQFVDLNAYRFRAGVTVTQAGPGNSLELVPVEGGFTDDGSIQAGQTWTSPSGGVKIVVDSASVGGPAHVAVTTKIRNPQILTRGFGEVAMVGRSAFTRTTGWPSGTVFNYVWRANGQLVSRAATYKPPPTRRGHELGLWVTGTLPSGDRVTAASSTTKIGYGRFSAQTPRVSGTLKVGRTVTAVRGYWSPAATKYYYRWYRSTKVIPGATKSTYKLTQKDKGHRIRVRIVGRRDGYAPLFTYSRYTAGPTR